MKVPSRISPLAKSPVNPSESNRARLQRTLREMLAEKARVRKVAKSGARPMAG